MRRRARASLRGRARRRRPCHGSVLPLIATAPLARRMGGRPVDERLTRRGLRCSLSFGAVESAWPPKGGTTGGQWSGERARLATAASRRGTTSTPQASAVGHRGERSLRGGRTAGPAHRGPPPSGHSPIDFVIHSLRGHVMPLGPVQSDAATREPSRPRSHVTRHRSAASAGEVPLVQRLGHSSRA